MGLMTICLGLAMALSDARTNLVHTESGPVLGAERCGVWAWLGIPYAASPVGDRRWRPPIAAPPWHEPRLAQDSFVCPQPDPANPGRFRGSEETCLQINVFSAMNTKSPPKAVYVYYHGGGNIATGPELPGFDPSRLIQRSEQHGEPIIVFTPGYRLGGLGFLALPALTAESVEGTSGNYALLDQIFALKWVHRNAMRFGAAEDFRVTIGGESAGAYNTAALLASPLATGLFDGAIFESSYHARGILRLSDAESVGATGIASTACGNRTARDTVSCLRDLPAQAAYMLFPCARGLCSDTSWEVANLAASIQPIANIDGYALYCAPLQAIRSRNNSECGVLPRASILVGGNWDEAASNFIVSYGIWGNISAGERDALAWQLYKDIGESHGRLVPESQRDMVLAATHRLFQPDPTSIAHATAWNGVTVVPETWQWNQMYNDVLGLCSAYLTAKAVADVGDTAFLFAFSLTPSALPDLGATHSTELAYVFGSFAAIGQVWGVDWTPTEEEKRLSEASMDYWLRFIHSGKPDPVELPMWPQAILQGDQLSGWMEFGHGPLPHSSLQFRHAQRCDFWMTAIPPSPHEVVITFV